MENTAVSFSETTLVAALAERDVHHLRLATLIGSPLPLTTAVLIEALACSHFPRLRQALIPLFLRHPEYADYVPALALDLDERFSLVLQHMYTTAVYLQRFWHTTLSLYLGQFPLLPDHFGQSKFNLPASDIQFGEAGLRALADLFQQKTGHDWLSVYHSTNSLFLAQLSLGASYVS